MKYLNRLLGHWPVVLGALVAAGIVHICTVFALPSFYHSDAYSRLARTLPSNAFVILPQARPRAQVLPYQLPATRYAICRFDITDSPVAVRATLAEPGWTLSAYTSQGESFYVLPASEQRRVNLSLLILPPGDRFLGPITEARNYDPDLSTVISPSREGLIVIQAPLKGRTYAAEIEQALAQIVCRKVGL